MSAQPFTVVHILADGYAAVARYSELVEAAADVVERLRHSATITIIRNGITGQRITRREAIAAAKGQS